MPPIDQLPPPPELRPPPPASGRLTAWAATHPIAVALPVAFGVALVCGAINLFGRGDRSAAGALGSAVLAGLVFGASAYLGQRPVRREHEVRLGIVLALVPWVILVGFDASLFTATIIIAFVTVTPLMANHLALRTRDLAARARDAWDVPTAS